MQFMKSRRPRGQAIIWLLATLAASAAVMLAVFNTSQITVGKQRAVNAADAAALAGATAQARLLNLMAYTNRSVIANEVFVAQMLSMESWLQYVDKSSKNLSTVFAAISATPLAPVAAPISNAFNAISNAAAGARTATSNIVNVLIPIQEGLKAATKTAQMTIHGFGALLAQDVAKSVVQSNRTNFGARHDPGVVMADSNAVKFVTFAINQSDWWQFSKLYQNSERGDARQILLDSRDRFTADRPGSSFFNLTLPLGLSGLKKNGGSQLVGYNRWEHQDTLEWWVTNPFCVKNCTVHTPVGWGRATAANSNQAGTVWAPNRSAQQLARAQGGQHSGWSGVPALYDVKDKTPGARANLGLDFIVAVSRAGASDFSSEGLGMGSALASPLGSPDVTRKQLGNGQAAIAKARVFFERPRRGLTNDFTASSLWRPDQAKEYGSLYSPYWQARLRDVTLGQKTAVVAAMGLTPDYVIYTPGAQ